MHVLRVFLFVTACGAAGFFFFTGRYDSPGPGVAGALAGLLFGLVVELAVRGLRDLPSRVLAGSLLGLLGAATVFAVFLSALPGELLSGPSALFLQVLGGLAFAYLGLVLGARKGEEFSLEEFLAPLFRKPSDDDNCKILDTSVIIDGRIADLGGTGFLEGTFVVPQFVLQELQHIADSPESLKRNRGRRGLDILQKMQKMPDLHIRITDQDFPKIREVDSKLIALARKLRGKVVTNDFNLTKVAELNGVAVLNINQLANALKPVFLTGELMKVHILKEGKEMNQGVAYLEDGTMVVVDNGRKYIGRTAEVSVTSVLQTTAGRMIFSQVRENGLPEDRDAGDGSEAAGG